MATSETGAFLCAMPRYRGHVFEPESFRRALALRLAGSTAFGEAELAAAECPKCHSKSVDVRGRHAVGCGDAWGQRHTSTKEEFGHAAAEAGQAVQVERILQQIADRAGVAGQVVQAKSPVRATYEERCGLGGPPHTLAGVVGLTAFDLTIRSPFSAALRGERKS